MTKQLVSIFLSLMKCFGLIQFNVSMSKFNDISIFISKPWMFYSVLISILNIMCTIIAIQNAIEVSITNKLILMLIFRLKIVVGFARTALLYIFQIYNCKSYINFLKESVFIHSHLNKLFSPGHFMDKRIAKCIRTKMGLWLFQTIFMLSNVLAYIHIFNGFSLSWKYETSLFSVCYVILSNIVKTTINNIYFASMLIVMQFYTVVNKKVSKIMQNVLQMGEDGKSKLKMQAFCDFSDELDRISNIFDDVTTFLNKQLRFFSLQLLLLIIDCFCSVLYEVIVLIYILSKLSV